MSANKPASLSGACLCGGVAYRIDGPRRDVILCHCENCRRTHGHVAAYTAVDIDDLVLTSDETLKWYHDESPKAWRGFCGRCGGSLFWDARDGRGRMAVAAGTLDNATGLKCIGHVYVAEAGHYYEIDDALPRFQHGNKGALEDGGGG